MKKRTFLMMATALLFFGTQPAAAQYDPSASTEIFDLSPFSDSKMLNLFYDALQKGRQYPTEAEFEAAGFNMLDIEFVRSHVQRRAVIDDQANQLYPSVKNTRRFWMNTPSGTTKGSGGFPSSNTGDDTYTMWNYTHLFGSWNHGLFSAPGSWTDAAHRNGTDIMSGIKFFEGWTPGSGDETYSKMISEKNSDGTYKYVEPLINILLYFGSDGINYNWEDASYSEADVVAFHKALYKKAAQKGLNNFHIGLYTQQSTLTANNANAIFGNSEGRTADTFLNYQSNDFASTFNFSLRNAQNAMGTTDGLYAGAWIVTMNRTWTRFAGNDMGMVLWGEHASSRFWSNNVGTDGNDFQSNYQKLYDRAFCGGNRNAAMLPTMNNSGNDWAWNGDTPPLAKFGGIATYFPERSTIQGNFPFNTYFGIGGGDFFAYKGKKTHGNWYNMSSQDFVPTYRWLVYKSNTKTADISGVMPEFTTLDAYMGGSSLLLKGTATSTGNDIVLFRTKLTPTTGAPYAKVAVKTGKEGTTSTLLYLILKVGDTWKSYAVGSTSSSNWEEKVIQLDGISASDQIDFIGLRVKGNRSNYSLYVGEIQLNDEVKATPAAVKDLTVEVKKETTSSLSVKAAWALDAIGSYRNQYGMTYNDEANVDHFEVLYKNGENGRISLVSTVQSWSAYVGDIEFESSDDRPFIGVRSVSTDFKTYSDPIWIEVPRSTNVPESGSSDGLAYGVTEVNPDADGYTTALNVRYLTSVTTTGASVSNLNYSGTKCSNNSNYIDGTSAVLKVKQGDEINLNYVWATDGDGIQWCVMKAYADWNANGMFEGGTDELLVEQGTANTCNDPMNTKENSSTPMHVNGYSTSPLVPFTFKVPDDAVCGTYRIRIVFNDAWFPHPGPVGLTHKGFSLDLGVEVTGTNEERKPTPDTHDQGIADEPDQLVVDGIQTTHSQASDAFVKGGKVQFSNVQKAWIFTTDGKLVNFAKNPTQLSTFSFAPGIYIIRMENNNVVRTRKVVVK